MDAKETTKLLGRDFLIAVFFILSITAIGAVGSLIGVGQINPTDLGSLGASIRAINIASIAWISFMLMAIGALGLFWARVSRVIGVYLKVKSSDQPSEVGTKKIKIVSWILYGALISIILSGLNALVKGLNPQLSLTDLQSLQNAFQTQNWLLLIGAIIAIAVTGVIVIRMRKLYPFIENNLPKKIDH